MSIPLSIKAIAVAAALFALAHGPAALAATPVLSGTYTLTFSELCQAAAKPRALAPGHLSETVAVISFNNAAGTFKAAGIQNNGDLVVVTTSGSNPMKQTPFSKSGPYATTASTLRLGDKTYQAFYGNIIGGIAHSVNFIGVVSPGCSTRGAALRQ